MASRSLASRCRMPSRPRPPRHLAPARHCALSAARPSASTSASPSRCWTSTPASPCWTSATSTPVTSRSPSTPGSTPPTVWPLHHATLGGANGYWTYSGASHADRRDWVQPVRRGFEQRNFMGMNASDYGGGTPVVDVWRRDVGLAIGHLALQPQLVALPVMAVGDQVDISLRGRRAADAGPGPDARHAAELHRHPPRRLLCSVGPLPTPDGSTGPRRARAAFECLRGSVVCLGLRARLLARLCACHAAQGAGTGIQVGRAGRRLAAQDRRLDDTRPDQVPARYGGYEGAGGRHSTPAA